MKKFYTVLAALCGAAMVANAATVLPKIGETVTMNTPQVAMQAAPMQVVNTAATHFNAPVALQAPTASQLDGKKYSGAGYFRQQNSLEYWEVGSTTIKMIDAETVEVTGLLSVNNTWKCKYDAAKGIITVPQDVITLNFSDGSTTDVFLAVAEFNDDQTTTKVDLQIAVDFEKRMMQWIAGDDGQYYTSCCGLFIVDQPTSAYMINYALFWDEFNCHAVGYKINEDLSVDTETLDGFNMYYTIKDGNIYFANVGGFGTWNTEVEFVLDPANSTATVDNQVVASFTDNGETTDIYMMDQNLNTNLEFEMSSEEQDGTLYSLLIFNDALFFADSNSSLYGAIYQPYFVVPNFDLFNIANVENVEINNANAPVEYFNLQGVRVANPENGLYIRRQGNEATKVLVK